MSYRKYFLMILIFGVSSCEKDFLNVVPDNIATIDLAFNNRATAERFLSTCYTYIPCLLYTSPSPRDATLSRMPASA